MGVDYFPCDGKGCGTILNDCSCNYTVCEYCQSSYCVYCTPDWIMRYAFEGIRCRKCDPYNILMDDSEFLAWADGKYSGVINTLRDEYRATLEAHEKVLTCFKCGDDECYDLDRNEFINTNGLMSVGWCCRCSCQDTECGYCKDLDTC